MQEEVFEDGVRKVRCAACFPALKVKVVQLLEREGETCPTDDEIARIIIYTYNRGTDHGGVRESSCDLNNRLGKLVIKSDFEDEFGSLAYEELSTFLPRRPPFRYGDVQEVPEPREMFDQVGKFSHLITGDETCTKWTDELWHSLIKSEPTAVTEFSTCFAWVLREHISATAHSKIVRLYFLVIAHIFMLDKNRKEEVEGLPEPMSDRLRPALFSVGGTTRGVANYMNYLCMWQKSREYEYDLLRRSQGGRIEMCDALWSEWRCLNIGISSIGWLAMDVIEQETEADGHICDMDCIEHRQYVTLLTDHGVAYVNDVASHKKDRVLGDELNIFLLAEQEGAGVGSAGVEGNEATIIAKLARGFERKVGALWSERLCRRCKMWYHIMRSIYHGNVAVSLYSKRYQGATTLLCDY